VHHEGVFKQVRHSPRRRSGEQVTAWIVRTTRVHPYVRTHTLAALSDVFTCQRASCKRWWQPSLQPPCYRPRPLLGRDGEAN